MRLLRKLHVHTLSPMKVGRLFIALCACAFCFVGLKSMISLEGTLPADAERISPDHEVFQDAPNLLRPPQEGGSREPETETNDNEAFPGWLDASTIPEMATELPLLTHIAANRQLNGQLPAGHVAGFSQQNGVANRRGRIFRTRQRVSIASPGQLALPPPGGNLITSQYGAYPAGANTAPMQQQFVGNMPGNFAVGPGVQTFGVQPAAALPKVTVHERLVHFDLKGAPPLITYYKEIFPLLKKLGATGLLMEYEDMFPFSGRLKIVNAGNAYSKEDIAMMLRLAKENGLYVIPLVQTFGHLEFVLKHGEFRHLREVDQFQQALCPTRNGTMQLVEELIEQTMALHPDAEYLHIGADEVFHLGMCSECAKATIPDPIVGKRNLFLSYIAQVLTHIKLKYPKIKPIMWDDMFHTMTPVDIANGLGDLCSYVEPMIWSYYPTWNNHLPGNGDLYRDIFPNLWGATAFKGSAGETLQIPNIRTQGMIHTSWIDALRFNGQKMKNFRGIVLTGWSRYDHFYPLCELFPVSIPSLAINLQILVDGEMNLPGMQKAAKSLNCANEPSTLEFTNVDPNLEQFGGCSFPGVEVFRTVHSILSITGMIQGYLDELKIKFPEYQMKSGYVQGSRVGEHLTKLGSYEVMLREYLRQANASFRLVFDQSTLNEWEAGYVEPVWSRLQSWKAMFTKGAEAGVWPARPLNVPVLVIPNVDPNTTAPSIFAEQPNRNPSVPISAAELAKGQLFF